MIRSIKVFKDWEQREHRFKLRWDEGLNVGGISTCYVTVLRKSLKELFYRFTAYDTFRKRTLSCGTNL